MTDSPNLQQIFASWGYMRHPTDKSLFFKAQQKNVSLYIRCDNERFTFYVLNDDVKKEEEYFANLNALKEYLTDYWDKTFPK